MIIYRVINKINDKSYIGQTVGGLEKRRRQHIWDALAKRTNMHFHNALLKYGEDNFDWIILHKCNNIDELNRLEIYYIGYYDTYNNGYNLTLGGMGHLGIERSKETRKRISESNKGRVVSEETRYKQIIAAKNRKPISIETRQKMSESQKGRKHSEAAKQKMSMSQSGSKNAMFGRKVSKEIRRKISESQKIDLINQRFGKLLVLRETGQNKWGNFMWFCKCDCGNNTTVDSHSLLRGSTKSCGCISKEIGKNHSHSKKYIVTTPEGEELFVHGLVNWCRNWKKDKLSAKALGPVATGRRPHYKGYKCRYAG